MAEIPLSNGERAIYQVVRFDLARNGRDEVLQKGLTLGRASELRDAYRVNQRVRGSYHIAVCIMPEYQDQAVRKYAEFGPVIQTKFPSGR